ncbi:hypothetical protein [Saccharopolyspora spinosa]|uniref:hypothetical protein n=1 Tax=Saccharopolyspora spinosa TaxID=60894 RepID=UPI00376EDF85
MEELEGLTEEQEVALAELRPKAQQWQKQKKGFTDRYRAGRAAAARVAELEELDGLTEEQEVELAELRPKAQQWQKRKERAAEYRRAGKAAVARVVELEELEGLTEEQEVELAELRPKAQQWQKEKERDADWHRARKAAARVAELEKLKEQGPLTEEQGVELAELRLKVAEWGRKKQDREVTETGVGGPVADRVAGSEGVSGWAGADQDYLDVWSADVDLDAWLARVVPDELGVQVPQGTADAGVMLDAGAYEEFVATELPAFLGQDAGDDAVGVGGAGSVAGGFDFAGFLPDYTDWEGLRGEVGESSRGVKRRKVDAAPGAEAVSGSPGDGGSGVLTPTDQAAQQDPSAERKRKWQENNTKQYNARKAAAARVAELEALKGQGPLTEEQEAELAELRSKVAQQKQKKKERDADRYQAVKVAAARVAELEALKEQGPLTGEQEAELAELQPKAQQKAQQKRKWQENNTKQYNARKAAAARVAELEALKERGPLTEEQEAELAKLRPKAQQKQKKNDYDAARVRAGKVAAARVAELEALAEQGPLTDEQEAELVRLRPKAHQWQKQKEGDADRYWAGKAAADRVVVLEALAERGPLTVEQVAELVELRPKALQWQKKKDYEAARTLARKVAADRVVVLEKLTEQGRLTDEQEAELAELRSKVAGRKKKALGVTETGVGGALLVDRGVGPEGVSGRAGADQVDLGVWSADVDLDAWLARAVADVEGVQVPQGAADAGVMLGEGAYEEFVANELAAFLGQDAGDDAAGAGSAGRVVGGFDFAGFLPDYGEGRVPLGCLGVKALTGCFSVSRLRGMGWGRMRGCGGVWGVGGCRSGSGG